MHEDIGIATGKKVLSAKITNRAVPWPKLVEKLLRFTVTEEKYSDYMKMPHEQQSRIKDVGYFIGGIFNGTTRDRKKLKYRSLVTLDLDHLPFEDFGDIELAYAGLEYVVHSTHKHSEETPRYRVVFLPSRNITPEEYNPVARRLAEMLDINFYDHTAFRITQLMYWPSASLDGLAYSHHNEGNPVNVDEILSTYDNWRDFGEWPVTDQENKLRDNGLSEAEDPFKKKGIMGTFCRQYDIHTAIEKFELPYERTDHEGRYRPEGSTGASGAVVYPSEMIEAAFLFSHHESDVVGGMNVNAWDLVRMHKFNDLDTQEEYDVPSDRPSYQAMTSMVLSLDEVSASAAREEFSDMPGQEAPIENSAGSSPETSAFDTPAPAAITYESLMAHLDKEEFDRADRKKLLNDLAVSKLDVGDTSEIIKRAMHVTGLGKRELTSALKDIQNKIRKSDEDRIDSIDVEAQILDLILSKYDKGKHIKRIGMQWWAYNNGLWSPKDNEYVAGLVLQIIHKFKANELDDADPLLIEYFDATKVSSIASVGYVTFTNFCASRETSEDPLKLTRRISTPVINCLNCELYFLSDGTVEKRDHNPDHFFTTQLNANYDPDATAPEWDRFLNIVTQDAIDQPSLRRHLEEVMGYAIQMSRTFKAFLLLKGTKDSGKTTLSTVLERLLGRSFLAMEMSSFGDGRSSFAESNLQGKQIVCDDDFKKGVMLPDGFLKKCSEEKRITADVKFSAPINFVSRAMPMILSNYWPQTKDVTEAMRERALVFEMKHRLTKAEKSNERRDIMLNEELSGILNALIPAISRLFKRKEFEPSIDNDLAHNAWVNHANPVTMFIEEVLAVGEAFSTPRSDMWAAYTTWFRDSNPSGKPSSKAEFFERMESATGRKAAKLTGVMCFKGYKIRKMDPTEEFTNEGEE